MDRQEIPDEVPCEDPSDFKNLTIDATEDEDEHDQSQEFHVVRILAEQMQEGEKRYLVFWENYTIKWATWEPRESFSDSIILDEWAKRRGRQVRGEVKPFNVQGWKEAAVKRRRLRKIKRKRAGWLVSSDEDSSTDEADNSCRLPLDERPEQRPRKAQVRFREFMIEPLLTEALALCSCKESFNVFV